MKARDATAPREATDCSRQVYSSQGPTARLLFDLRESLAREGQPDTESNLVSRQDDGEATWVHSPPCAGPRSVLSAPREKETKMAQTRGQGDGDQNHSSKLKSTDDAPSSGLH